MGETKKGGSMHKHNSINPVMDALLDGRIDTTKGNIEEQVNEVLNNKKPVQEEEKEDEKELMTPVIDVYEQEQFGIHTYDMERKDLHANTIRDYADVQIEETGIHTPTPFSNKIEDIAKWSKENAYFIGEINSNFMDRLKGLKKEFEYKANDGDFDIFNETTAPNFKTRKEIIEYCYDRIKAIHKYGFSLEDVENKEIEHRKNNINKLLWKDDGQNFMKSVINRLNTPYFATCNQCTILQNVHEAHGISKKTKKYYENYSEKERRYDLSDMLRILQDPRTNERDKKNRQIVFPSFSGMRPKLKDNECYLNWNGLQVIDIDLKFSPSFRKSDINAFQVRDILFDILSKKYTWLLAVTVSASKRGLHVYTKVSPMHKLYKDLKENGEMQRYWYRMNYIQKFASIACILNKECDVDIYNDDTKSDERKVLDSAMANPTQGIAMNYDSGARINNDFVDLHPVYNYHVPPVEGLKLDEWLTHPSVINRFSNWLSEYSLISENNNVIRKKKAISALGGDFNIDKTGRIDMLKLGSGDRYNTRWRIVNTVASIYGDNDDRGRNICHYILMSEETQTYDEIESYYTSAINNHKESDLNTINRLKGLGIDIKVDKDSVEEVKKDDIETIRHKAINDSYRFNYSNPSNIIRLKDNEYLGMKKDLILSSFNSDKVNIIESAPGTGKTELFKTLARESRVCLVIPFTPVIKSKIVDDKEFCEIFDVYYDDKNVSNIEGGRSVVMTFDKFSQIPESKYKLFDHIVIDESHLLFTSTYRLQVVAKVLDNINNFIENTVNFEIEAFSSISIPSFDVDFVKPKSTNIILMSGTLTNEIPFFKERGILNYIKIEKRHPHAKDVEFILCPDQDTKNVRMAVYIAELIQKGIKVIHPTNKGDMYAKRITEYVNRILCRDVEWQYYKRSNSDEKFIEEINKNTTVDDIELMFCSDYLSVGVDIKDTCDFEIVFSDDFTAESIEQFNNRLRATDINCKVFWLAYKDNKANPNLFNFNRLDIKDMDLYNRMLMDEKTISEIQHMTKDSDKYFAVLGQLTSKYYAFRNDGSLEFIRSSIDVDYFAYNYETIAKSLIYVKTAMIKKYGYTATVTVAEPSNETRIEEYIEVTKEATRVYKKEKSDSIKEVIEYVSTDDVYDILKGRGSIKYVRDDEYFENEEVGIAVLKDGDDNDESKETIVKYHGKHKRTIEEALKQAYKLRDLYDKETTLKILEACVRSNDDEIINQTELKRYSNLVKLLFVDQNKGISEQTKSIIEKSYTYINPNNTEQTVLVNEDYDMMREDIKSLVQDNIKDISNTFEGDFKTDRRKGTLDFVVDEFINTLFHKRKGKNNTKISFRQVFEFNSDSFNDMVENDDIISQIFDKKKSSENICGKEQNSVSLNHLI